MSTRSMQSWLRPSRAALAAVIGAALLGGCQSLSGGPFMQGGKAPKPEVVTDANKAEKAADTSVTARSDLYATYPGTRWQRGPRPPQAGTTEVTPPPQPTATAVGDKLTLTPYLDPREVIVSTTPPPLVQAPVPPPPPEGTRRAAILLPLTGPNGALGQALLNAAQMAMFDFAPKRFELLIHDTGGVVDGAEEAVSFAIADRAEIILGPLLAQNVLASAPAARAATVPMVAFSSDRSVVGGGVYTMGFFPEAEVGRVIFYAVGKGMRRFAVLAPDTLYGRTVIDAFLTSVEAAGAEVSRVEYYTPGAEDHSEIVKRIADYEFRRQALLQQRAELEARTDELAEQALKRLENLQTIGDLDYDALLLPDGGDSLQSIAALLPFYDVDPASVRMLGTGLWDVKGIGAEPALQGGWYAAPDPNARQDFVQRYQTIYGARPPRIATLAYDAVALAAVLASQGDFSEAAITAPGGFAGRDGIFRFLPSGVAERGLAVLRAGRKENTVISPAPSTFAPAIN